MAKRKVTESQIQDMLRDGIIEHHGLVQSCLHQKVTAGGFVLTIENSMLLLRKTVTPLPLIQDIFDRLERHSYIFHSRP